MKKIDYILRMTAKPLLLSLFLVCFTPRVAAGEGDGHFGIQTGIMYPRIFNATLSYDLETNYHNAYEVYVDYFTQWDKCGTCDKVCMDSFWKRRYGLGIGAAYKPAIHRGHNQFGRLRLGADVGTNTRGFALGIEVGYEYVFSFQSGVQLVIQQKNEVTFWSKPTFKNGLLLGVRFPM